MLDHRYVMISKVERESSLPDITRNVWKSRGSERARTVLCVHSCPEFNLHKSPRLDRADPTFIVLKFPVSCTTDGFRHSDNLSFKMIWCMRTVLGYFNIFFHFFVLGDTGNGIYTKFFTLLVCLLV